MTGLNQNYFFRGVRVFRGFKILKNADLDKIDGVDTIGVHVRILNHGVRGVSRRKVKNSYQKLRVPPCPQWLIVLK